MMKSRKLRRIIGIKSWKSRTWVMLIVAAACVTGIAIQPRIGAATNPSGVPLPVGNLNGWKQVFTDDFTTDVPLGSFPGANTKWSVGYTDNTPDTAGKGNGGKSVYYPSKVLSVSNGSMDMYLHSEGGKSMGAAPMPKLTSGWPYSSMLYGRYVTRFRADSLKGFKTAWLLWPDSDVWSDGEIDFPEGDLSSTIGAFSHCVGNPSSNCLAADSGKFFTSWHTAVIEWVPGKVSFILDGTVIGSTSKSVPSKAMHYILQTESCLTGCPSSSTAGHLQLDWIALYSYSPGTVASSPSETPSTSVTPTITPTPSTSTTPTPSTGLTQLNDATVGTGPNQFNFSGAWSVDTPSGAYMNDNHFSNAAGSSYQVQFTGTKAHIYSQKGTDAGIVAVSVDGGAEAMIDTYSATRQEQVLLYSTPTLTNATHTLKVRITGTKNAASTGAYGVADRVDIESGAIVMGDLNNDGKVNAFDLSILLTRWGTAQAPADIDRSGTVNVMDLSILLSHWTG